MREILISIRPKWCEKICHVIGKDEMGKPIYEKRIEVRKSAPKEVPFKCYIYMTQGAYKDLGLYSEGIYQNRMKVIGEFICDKVDKIIPLRHTHYNYIGVPIANVIEYGIWNDDLPQMQMTKKEINDYGKGKILFGWHISDLKIYDKPKELSDFISPSKVKKCVDYCINGICSNLGYEELCGAIRRCEYKKLTRPPQSWQYVKELGNE